jgi:acetylornithine deacetylase/succinyl-diaminopimelate desuccinylase-like protein
MYQQLKQMSETLKPQLVHVTQQLIRLPSTSFNEGEVAWRVTDLLEDLGYNLVFGDDAGNVVGVLLQEHGERNILLTSHMDTVEPACEWKHSPYGAEVDGGRIFGVGASDCKSGLVSQIFAGYVLNKASLPLKGNLIFAATVAEESGCSAGLKFLLEDTLPRLGIRPSTAILGEPTGLNLYCGHDGWVEVDVRVGARSLTLVKHAAEVLCRTLSCVDSPSLRNGRSLMNVGQPVFEDGKAPHGVLTIARRLFRNEVAGEFIAWMQRRAEAAVAGLDCVRIDVRAHHESRRLYTGRVQDIEASRPSWYVDPFEPVVDTAREGLLAGGCPCTASEWRLERPGMGTGGGLLTCNGIPTLGFGPGEESCAHLNDESVVVDRLSEAVYGTAVLAHRFIGAPVFGVSA